MIFEFSSPPASTGTFNTRNGPPTSSSDVTIYYSFNIFDIVSDTDWKRSYPGGYVTITNYDSEKKIVTGTFSATLVGTVQSWFVQAEGKFKIPIVE